MVRARRRRRRSSVEAEEDDGGPSVSPEKSLGCRRHTRARQRGEKGRGASGRALRWGEEGCGYGLRGILTEKEKMVVSNDISTRHGGGEFGLSWCCRGGAPGLAGGAPAAWEKLGLALSGHGRGRGAHGGGRGGGGCSGCVQRLPR